VSKQAAMDMFAALQKWIKANDANLFITASLSPIF
jgi:hypothetical protein